MYNPLHQNQKYYWYSNPELESLIDSSNHFFTSIPNGNFPLEDTRFTIVVKDRFGCVSEDEIDYIAIETKADFSWTTIDSN